jgi:hypothetical protein
MIVPEGRPGQASNSAPPSEIFRSVFAAAARILKQRGFAREGHSFYVRGAHHWGVINFQKSRYNDPNLHSFTLNLGVYAARLHPGGSLPRRKPSVRACHWQERLGIVAKGRDEWWEITVRSDRDALAREVEDAVLRYALPEVARYMSDEALRDYYLSGRRPTNMDPLAAKANLAVLLEAIGPEVQRDLVVEELRFHPDRARLHQLGFRFDGERLVPFGLGGIE